MNKRKHKQSFGMYWLLKRTHSNRTLLTFEPGWSSYSWTWFYSRYIERGWNTKRNKALDEIFHEKMLQNMPALWAQSFVLRLKNYLAPDKTEKSLYVSQAYSYLQGGYLHMTQQRSDLHQLDYYFTLLKRIVCPSSAIVGHRHICSPTTNFHVRYIFQQNRRINDYLTLKKRNYFHLRSRSIIFATLVTIRAPQLMKTSWTTCRWNGQFQTYYYIYALNMVIQSA